MSKFAMSKLLKNRGKRPAAPLAVSAVTCLLFAGILALSATLLTRLRDFDSSRREYDALRALRPPVSGAAAPAPTLAPETKAEALSQLNPDYAGWLSIADSKIDYPVVRGDDNEKYMVTSFSGDANPNGAIFMDYRCADVDAPHTVIYGHNVRQGQMFGDLRRLLDAEYLAEHPVITLERNGTAVSYRIFSARNTDIGDPAYQLDFSAPGAFEAFAADCGAPDGAKRILTLSTCVSGLDTNERLVVQGVLE